MPNNSLVYKGDGHQICQLTKVKQDFFLKNKNKFKKIQNNSGGRGGRGEKQ